MKLMVAKFNGKCAKCEQKISKGGEIVYTGQAWHPTCFEMHRIATEEAYAEEDRRNAEFQKAAKERWAIRKSEMATMTAEVGVCYSVVKSTSEKNLGAVEFRGESKVEMQYAIKLARHWMWESGYACKLVKFTEVGSEYSNMVSGYYARMIWREKAV